MTTPRRTSLQSTRVYVDLVGDLFHMGHVEFLKAARAFGDWLLVGVLSDEIVAAYKRRPIMSHVERIAVVQACRYVDQVVPEAPFTVTLDFVARLDIDVVVHGDDISQASLDAAYGPVAAAGKLRLVRYTRGISTTELMRRIQDRTL